LLDPVGWFNPQNKKKKRKKKKIDDKNAIAMGDSNWRLQ
jgi:hypothetical protein